MPIIRWSLPPKNDGAMPVKKCQELFWRKTIIRGQIYFIQTFVLNKTVHVIKIPYGIVAVTRIVEFW
ncbi:hypothetical protein AL048_09615 [Pseudomonas syringae pv. castaneae]|nr:hypothetical protein AL048_09615 [Pseudomonas syringae pv. castaneae]